MDLVPEQFRPSAEHVLKLVTEHPLAWLVTESLDPRLLPTRPVVNRSGVLTGLSGHLPRSSSMYRDLVAKGVGSFLFTGPSAYISPSWFQNRKQAPTWASMSAAFICDISFPADPAELRESLRDLIEAMETGREQPWSLHELGERYEQLARHIIPFHAKITASRAAFRLCQDEDETTFSDIVAGLGASGQESIAELMRAARVPVD